MFILQPWMVGVGVVAISLCLCWNYRRWCYKYGSSRSDDVDSLLFMIGPGISGLAMAGCFSESAAGWFNQWPNFFNSHWLWGISLLILTGVIFSVNFSVTTKANQQ